MSFFFIPAILLEITNELPQSLNSSCDLDTMPTTVLKNITNEISFIILSIPCCRLGSLFSFPSSVANLIRVVSHICVAILDHLLPSPLSLSQGSVLGPILFNFYTTLSSLISSSAVSHLLYADDTAVYILHPSLAISDLQLTVLLILLISSCMSSKYLTLSTTQTEFHHIDLPQQISKIINPSLFVTTAQLILPTPSAKEFRLHLRLHFLSPSRSPPFITHFQSPYQTPPTNSNALAHAITRTHKH